MATITHYIHSHYDPNDRERLERETGQLSEEDAETAWAREASRVARRLAPAPHFVSATIPYGEWNSNEHSSSKSLQDGAFLGNSLSGWYRSLTSAGAKKSTPPPLPSTTANTKVRVHDPSSSSSTSAETAISTTRKGNKVERRNKNNWFIMNAIQSEQSAAPAFGPSTLADMLARHPPPLPSEERFNPPVFLEIGPSNIGFGMLQRSGWNEGEPLGPDVIRRKRTDEFQLDGDFIPIGLDKGKGNSKEERASDRSATRTFMRQEIIEVKIEDFDDVSEMRSVDVIDLTLSDDAASDADPEETKQPDSGGEASAEYYQDVRERGHEKHVSPSPVDGATTDAHMALDRDSPYARKALITPIATVLKSDRLGIGLKAKTVGPHKSSQKRVTHNAEALAAHIRTAEESRRRKQVFGRGHKGFERQRRRDEEKRKALLAELKSPW